MCIRDRVWTMGASHKNKNHENFFGRVWRHFRENLHMQISCYMVCVKGARSFCSSAALGIWKIFVQNLLLCVLCDKDCPMKSSATHLQIVSMESFPALVLPSLGQTKPSFPCLSLPQWGSQHSHESTLYRHIYCQSWLTTIITFTSISPCVVQVLVPSP